MISHKKDVLHFISSNLKDYLQKLNTLANEYDSVNKLEIYTSVNIDDLYQDNITDEGDYVKNFNPLL